MDRLFVPSFDPPWDFLRNSAPSVLIIGGNIYPTVDHAYQAYKSVRPQDREWVRNAVTPEEARKRGQEIVLREDFIVARKPLMKLFVTIKFTAYVEYRQKMTVTGDAIIQNHNECGDTYWGIYKGKGENNLGKILMEVRDIVILLR